MADFEREVVRIALVAGDECTVTDMTFDGCDIKGPAVLFLREDVGFVGSNFRGNADALLWEIPPERTQIIGAIEVARCKFNGCTFEGVGFAGPREFTEMMRASVPNKE
jgi:hypothetical protein